MSFVPLHLFDIRQNSQRFFGPFAGRSSKYDPKAIANMQFVPCPDEGLAPIKMVRVRVPHRANARQRWRSQGSCGLLFSGSASGLIGRSAS
jgi:hypothetical protein